MMEMRNGQKSACIEYGMLRDGLAHPISDASTVVTMRHLGCMREFSFC
jgi:hypothetical protein